MAPVRFSDGRSTYLPNSGGPPPGVRTPNSLGTQALSVYNRPSWAAGMSADRAAQEALNQRLIREAMDRARERAEELRRQAEERRRRMEEEERERRALEAQRTIQQRSRRVPGQPGMGGVPMEDRRVSDFDAYAAQQYGGIVPDGAVVRDPGMNVPGASLSPDIRFSGPDALDTATKLAASRNMEVVDLGNGVYGLRSPSMAPEVMGAEGWTRNVVRGIVSDRMYRASQKRDIAEERQEMYEGSPNWKELAERYEGENLENFWGRVARAQTDIWGEPTPIVERIPTGRYEPILDAEGNQVGAKQIMEEQIVGWDWTGDGQPEIDPTTGMPLDPSKVSRTAYLGMDPGDIIVNRPARPAEDADIDEWRRYYNGLRTAIAVPQYTPQSPLQRLNEMDVKERARFQKQLIAAQLVPADETIFPGQMDDVTVGLMAGLMADANGAGTNWETQLSLRLQEAEQRRAREAGSGGGYGGGGGGGGTTTYKQIQYTMTSVAQARSMLIGVLTEALGRYPTDSEVEEFLRILNKQERKSPVKTVTRTTTEGDMTTAVSRMTPSTVDAQALAEEFAEGIGGGEVAARKSDADYLNGFLERLGGASV